MRSVVVKGLVLSGALAGTLLQAPEPAHASTAAQGTRPCNSYSYCFYQDTGYGGWQLQYKTTNFGDFNNPPYSSRTGLRDKVSSIINNTGNTICVYNNRFLRYPSILRVTPYKDFPNLADIGWADKADFWRMVPGSGTCPSK